MRYSDLVADIVSIDPAKIAKSLVQAFDRRCGPRDDDADVRAVVAASLRDSGYVVWEAESPTLAFEILERERPIDLLVADYAMPEMNGLAVIDRAQTRQHGLRVLLMSGHAEILHAGGVSGIPLLAKPFKAAELKRRIAETLRAPSSDDRVDCHDFRLLAVSS